MLMHVFYRFTSVGAAFAAVHAKLPPYIYEPNTNIRVNFSIGSQFFIPKMHYRHGSKNQGHFAQTSVQGLNNFNNAQYGPPTEGPVVPPKGIASEGHSFVVNTSVPTPTRFGAGTEAYKSPHPSASGSPVNSASVRDTASSQQHHGPKYDKTLSQDATQDLIRSIEGLTHDLKALRPAVAPPSNSAQDSQAQLHEDQSLSPTDNDVVIDYGTVRVRPGLNNSLAVLSDWLNSSSPPHTISTDVSRTLSRQTSAESTQPLLGEKSTAAVSCGTDAPKPATTVSQTPSHAQKVTQKTECQTTPLTGSETENPKSVGKEPFPPYEDPMSGVKSPNGGKESDRGGLDGRLRSPRIEMLANITSAPRLSQRQKQGSKDASGSGGKKSPSASTKASEKPAAKDSNTAKANGGTAKQGGNKGNGKPKNAKRSKNGADMLVSTKKACDVSVKDKEGDKQSPTTEQPKSSGKPDSPKDVKTDVKAKETVPEKT
ncbi:hypothetical protein GGS21DRAFT_144614 [Xylaria nigripes]|nr:hypothetical protein GGS21DRAFT_144614 [Xylaria nigripes]